MSWFAFPQRLEEYLEEPVNWDISLRPTRNDSAKIIISVTGLKQISMLKSYAIRNSIGSASDQAITNIIGVEALVVIPLPDVIGLYVSMYMDLKTNGTNCSWSRSFADSRTGILNQ